MGIRHLDYLPPDTLLTLLVGPSRTLGDGLIISIQLLKSLHHLLLQLRFHVIHTLSFLIYMTHIYLRPGIMFLIPRIATSASQHRTLHSRPRLSRVLQLCRALMSISRRSNSTFLRLRLVLTHPLLHLVFPGPWMGIPPLPLLRDLLLKFWSLGLSPQTM